jgi:transposase, IS30 family
LIYKKLKRRKNYARRDCPYRDGEKMRLVTQRPKNIAARRYFGHCEGDTIALSGIREKGSHNLNGKEDKDLYLIKNDRKYSRGIMNKITISASIAI